LVTLGVEITNHETGHNFNNQRIIISNYSIKIIRGVVGFNYNWGFPEYFPNAKYCESDKYKGKGVKGAKYTGGEKWGVHKSV